MIHFFRGGVEGVVKHSRELGAHESGLVLRWDSRRRRTGQHSTVYNLSSYPTDEDYVRSSCPALEYRLNNPLDPTMKDNERMINSLLASKVDVQDCESKYEQARYAQV